MSDGLNVWDEAGILPMAIRLRKKGQCPREIDNLYGEIVVEIVLMATRLMPKEYGKGLAKYMPALLSEDVQGQMVFNALRAAEKFVDTRRNTSSIVNYLVKAVQRRLLNWVRDTNGRESKAKFVTETALAFDIAEYGETTSDLEGRTVYREKDMSVKDRKNFNNQPGDNDE